MAGGFEHIEGASAIEHGLSEHIVERFPVSAYGI